MACTSRYRRLVEKSACLAGRLRRCQTFLRTAGIEIVFSREGPAGSRIITMTAPIKCDAPATRKIAKEKSEK